MADQECSDHQREAIDAARQFVGRTTG